MPQFRPFRGIRYTAAAGALDDLLAPPYDVISPAQQRQLAGRSTRNAVHLELADGGEERYARVADLFQAWERDGFLQRDDIPMFYVYEQTFVEAGREYHRRALMAEVEAQPWDEGAVKPHEFTMSGPKEDRLKLLEATKVQFSPVFMIARDRAGQLRQFLDQTVESRAADAEATTIDGDRHRLWVIEAGRLEMRFLAPLLAESFYIADGHHRSAAAGRVYRARGGAGASAHFLTVTFPHDQVQILPYNRVLKDLNGHTPAALLAQLEQHARELEGGAATPARKHEQALYLAGRWYGLKVKPAFTAPADPIERLDVSILQRHVLAPLFGIEDPRTSQRIGFVGGIRGTAELEKRVGSGECAVAFSMFPTTIAELMAIADAGETMPPKSTFFFPKLLTGLVFNPLR